MNRDEYAASIKNAAVNIGKRAVMSRLITLWPPFGLPVIKQVTELIVERTLSVAVNETEMGIFFQYIDMRVHNQQTDFEKACHDYYKAQQGGTNEDLAKAEEKLKKEFAAFISLSS